jgi:SAM-dependent methyltransferase
MKCKICQETAITFYDPRMECDTCFCEQCQFIFKDKAAYVTLERERELYDQHNNTLESPGYVEMFEHFIDETIHPNIDSIHDVLEFGSGPGPVLSQLLEKHGLNVECYDKFFSPEKIYEGKQYDLITATEVIEHIDEPVGIMHFFFRHLRPGGYLAVMTQFHTNDIDDYLDWWYRADPTHICFYRPETFKKLANITGFEVLKHDEKKIVLMQKSREADFYA